MRIDLEFVAEHHPSPDGLKMIKAALKIPRKTFRAVPKRMTCARRWITSRRSWSDRSAITTGSGSAAGAGGYHSREVRPHPLSMTDE